LRSHNFSFGLPRDGTVNMKVLMTSNRTSTMRVSFAFATVNCGYAHSLVEQTGIFFFIFVIQVIRVDSEHPPIVVATSWAIFTQEAHSRVVIPIMVFARRAVFTDQLQRACFGEPVVVGTVRSFPASKMIRMRQVFI
jgi:hypothetical protein